MSRTTTSSAATSSFWETACSCISCARKETQHSIVWMSNCKLDHFCLQDAERHRQLSGLLFFLGHRLQLELLKGNKAEDSEKL